MSDIKERLDILRGNIQEEDFLLGKGLSNEVNIRMFCYGLSTLFQTNFFRLFFRYCTGV